MSLERMLSTTALAITLAVGGIGLAGPAVAQQEAAPMAPGATTTDFAEDELRAFIQAALAVSDLERAYVSQIEAASTDEEREAIVVEANEAMRTAIDEQEGIGVDRYIEIGQAAQSDPELNATLMAMLEEMQAE